jgi:hypothetical protein
LSIHAQLSSFAEGGGSAFVSAVALVAAIARKGESSCDHALRPSRAHRIAKERKKTESQNN